MLMLLHGSNADDRQWQRLGFVDALDAVIRRGDAKPTLALMPFGGDIANENRFDGATYDRLLLELLRRVERQYRVEDQPAIGGISRGGFWAYYLALRYPGRFAAAGGHSAYFESGALSLPATTRMDLARRLTDEACIEAVGSISRQHGITRPMASTSMHHLLKAQGVAHAYRCRVMPAARMTRLSWRQASARISGVLCRSSG